MQHLKGYCDHSCYRSFINRSEDYNWPPTNFSRTTSMVETTPIVTGGVLCGGLRTCQHRHTLLSIFTLPPPALSLPSLHLFVYSCTVFSFLCTCPSLTCFLFFLSCPARKVAVTRNAHIISIFHFQTQSDG